MIFANGFHKSRCYCNFSHEITLTLILFAQLEAVSGISGENLPDENWSEDSREQKNRQNLLSIILNRAVIGRRFPLKFHEMATEEQSPSAEQSGPQKPHEILAGRIEKVKVCNVINHSSDSGGSGISQTGGSNLFDLPPPSPWTDKRFGINIAFPCGR